MNRCTVFDKLEDEYGIKPENLTEREKAIIGLCTNDFLEHEEQALCLQPVSNNEVAVCECKHGFKLKNFDKCAMCGKKWKGRKAN